MNVLIVRLDKFSFHSKILEFCKECGRVGRATSLIKVILSDSCMSKVYRPRNIRGLAGALAVLLLIWLSVIPVHVQHTDGFHTQTDAFISAEPADHLDCLPFPLTPTSTDTEPCLALLTWNAGNATLFLPPSNPILRHFLVFILGDLPYQSPFVAKAWLNMASSRAPPTF